MPSNLAQIEFMFWSATGASSTFVMWCNFIVHLIIQAPFGLQCVLQVMEVVMQLHTHVSFDFRSTPVHRLPVGSMACCRDTVTPGHTR